MSLGQGVELTTEFLCCKLPGLVPEFAAVLAVKLSVPLLALEGLS